MKQAAIAAFALSVWIVSFPQSSRQPSTGISEKKGRADAQLAEDAHEKQQAAETAALNAILTTIAKNEQERAAERQQEAAVESENVGFQRWMIGLGIAQTLALIGTLIAVWYQAKKTADATEATRDSVVAIEKQASIMERSTAATERSALLQEAAMQQWIVCQNWTTRLSPRPDDRHDLEIGFEVVNPTSWPLTISTTGYAINRVQGWTLNKVQLSPHAPYTVRFSCSITTEQQSSYLTNRLVLNLFTVISYRDCFGIEKEQDVNGILNCSPNETTFTLEWFPDVWNPFRKDKKNGGQNPN